MSRLPPPSPVRWSYDGRAVDLLDQTLLPEEERVLRLESAEEVAEAIRALRIRGAPAIGIAGALGLALGVERAAREAGDDPDALSRRFREDRELLHATRPTGRNLGWALERLERAFDRALPEGADVAVRAVRDEADAVVRDEVEACRRIGEAGLELLEGEGGGVLTHCNTGALATGGVGTALAPLYLAAARGLPVQVFATETRPVLQGARLTAWELRRGGVPATVLTDLAAGALMKQGRIRFVIVGADRIAGNGDTANKIGTYALAVLAHHHDVPFYVAAPLSTFDPSLPSGDTIPIEERDGAEVRGVGGRITAAPEADVWNPAFDVTPAHLVTAFVTDRGILRPPYRETLSTLLEEAGRQ